MRLSNLFRSQKTKNKQQQQEQNKKKLNNLYALLEKDIKKQPEIVKQILLTEGNYKKSTQHYKKNNVHETRLNDAIDEIKQFPVKDNPDAVLGMLMIPYVNMTMGNRTNRTTNPIQNLYTFTFDKIIKETHVQDLNLNFVYMANSLMKKPVERTKYYQQMHRNITDFIDNVYEKCIQQKFSNLQLQDKINFINTISYSCSKLNKLHNQMLNTAHCTKLGKSNTNMFVNCFHYSDWGNNYRLNTNQRNNESMREYQGVALTLNDQSLLRFMALWKYAQIYINTIRNKNNRTRQTKRFDNVQLFTGIK